MNTPFPKDFHKKPVAPPVVSGGLPVLGHAIEFMRDPHKVIRRGYEEHGLLFTLDLGLRQAHVLLGPENHQLFFKETDGVFSKRRGYETLMKMFDNKLFTFAHSTEHTEQMKVILPLLKNNDRFIDLMLLEIDHFMEKTLGDEGEVDLVEAFGPLVMHIGARAFFGDQFREQLGAEYFDVYKQFSQGMDVVLPNWLPLPKFKRCREAKEKIEQMLYDLIQYRRKNPLESKDLFQELIESTYYGGRPVPDDLLISMLVFIPWAAHETTAGHVTWALIDLLNNPSYQELVQKNIDEILGDRKKYTLEDLKKLHTIDWTILEGERLAPRSAYYYERRER